METILGSGQSACGRWAWPLIGSTLATRYVLPRSGYPAGLVGLQAAREDTKPASRLSARLSLSFDPLPPPPTAPLPPPVEPPLRPRAPHLFGPSKPTPRRIQLHAGDEGCLAPAAERGDLGWLDAGPPYLPTPFATSGGPRAPRPCLTNVSCRVGPVPRCRLVSETSLLSDTIEATAATALSEPLPRHERYFSVDFRVTSEELLGSV